MKFNWKQAFSLGFGFMSIFLIWLIYNQFITNFLQAGNPQWELESRVPTPKHQTDDYKVCEWYPANGTGSEPKGYTHVN